MPGSIGFAGCQGSNALLADRAGVLWDVERFAHTVAPELASQKLTVTEAVPALADLPEKEVVALAGVGFKPAGVDVISGHSGIEVRELLSTLALLKLKRYGTPNASGAFVGNSAVGNDVRRPRRPSDACGHGT